MCRLIIAERKATEKYNKTYGLLKLFEALEKSCGGHGNGYALFNSKSNRIIKRNKGIKLSCKDIYNEIKKTVEYWDYMIFHTRICSSGTISEANVQPFSDSKGENILAMNGTLNSLSEFTSIFNMSDTAMIFNILRHKKQAKEVIKACAKMNAVFVGVSNGIPFAAKGKGDLVRWKQYNFFASELPNVTAKDITTLKQGYTWSTEGEQIYEKTTYNYSWYKPTKSYNTNDIYDSYDIGYADGYDNALIDYGIEKENEDEVPNYYYGYDYDRNGSGSIIRTKEEEAFYKKLMSE